MSMPSQYSQAAKTWLKIHQQLADGKAIRNVHTQPLLERIGHEWVPATLNHSEYDNSYVCSPYTAYISYAKQELPLLNNRGLELLGAIGIRLASVWLKAAQINRTLSINNWLFSTNLPNNDWSANDLQTATHDWVKRYPDHHFTLRSLNPKHHHHLITHLKNQGWLLMPARQVYLFDGQKSDWWKRNNCKNDQRLLRKTELTWFGNDNIESTDYAQMALCFRQLFIEKHSHYNPDYTEAYFAQLHQSGLVSFQGFRDQNDKLIGMVGLFTQQGIITAPILGYDTQQPKSLGLYRLLIGLVLKQTHESGLAMNLSSGAGPFKAMRGGEAVTEYTAYYVKHLPITRRWLIQGFSWLLNQTLVKLFERQQF